MIRLLSWNMQAGVSAYGEPVAQAQSLWLRRNGTELLALQEIDLPLLSLLQEQLPHYHWHFAPARSGWIDGRWQTLGNAIATRLPFGSVEARVLPQPHTRAARHMPRSALMLAINEPQPFTLITTHLEYHCPQQRQIQLQDLQLWHQGAVAQQRYASLATEGFYQAAAWPSPLLLCGDLNLPWGSAEYQWLLEQGWIDAGGEQPPLTCGVFDKRQWPEGPHCRDYMLANAELAPRLGRLWSDTHNPLSDHQPLFLELS
ncbi:MAG: endonuclease/exonuclease/phosphatase family protein [Aeromonadaceae bacterium]|nr:endonuclease/exonuclease/phosphatase family protein [Aeromonadaceae bacterium]